MYFIVIIFLLHYGNGQLIARESIHEKIFSNRPKYKIERSILIDHFTITRDCATSYGYAGACVALDRCISLGSFNSFIYQPKVQEILQGEQCGIHGDGRPLYCCPDNMADLVITEEGKITYENKRNKQNFNQNRQNPGIKNIREKNQSSNILPPIGINPNKDYNPQKSFDSPFFNPPNINVNYSPYLPPHRDKSFVQPNVIPSRTKYNPLVPVLPSTAFPPQRIPNDATRPLFFVTITPSKTKNQRPTTRLTTNIQRPNVKPFPTTRRTFIAINPTESRRNPYQPPSQPTFTRETRPTFTTEIQPTFSTYIQPTFIIEKPFLPTSTQSVLPTIILPSQPPLPPTTQPHFPLTTKPSFPPTTQPSLPPNTQPPLPPTTQPSLPPTTQTSLLPTTQPSLPPNTQPTLPPTTQPSLPPNTIPPLPPTTQSPIPPTTQPSLPPTTQPSLPPTTQPSLPPTTQPPLPQTTQPPLPQTTQPPLPPTTQSPLPPTTQPSLPPTTQPPLPQTTKSPLSPTTQSPVPPTTQPSLPPTTQSPLPPTTQQPLLPTTPKTEELINDNCGLPTANMIRGGTDIELQEIRQFPWLAIIGDIAANGSFVLKCGGTLVTRKHVLTAAHCFYEDNPTTVRLGEYNLFRDDDGAFPIDFPILQRAEFRFDPNTYRNDITIIILNQLVNLTVHINPICLPLQLREAMLEGEILEAFGWGTMGEEFDTVSPTPKKTILPVTNHTECKNIYARISAFSIIEDSQICAGGDDMDTCLGDSGGPLVRKENLRFTIVGITSYGPEVCGIIGLPSVYTKVGAYIDWMFRIFSRDAA